MEYIKKIKLSFNKLFGFLKLKEEIRESDEQLYIDADEPILLDNNTHTIDFGKSASLDNCGKPDVEIDDDNSNKQNSISTTSEYEDLLEKLEDIAYDYKFEQSKNESLQKKNLELKDKLKKSEEEKRIELEKNKELSREYEELEHDLGVEQSYISIINSLLKAKEVKVENVEESAAHALYNFVTEDFYDFFKKEIHKDEMKQIHKEIWQWTNVQKKTWLKNKKVIALIGEFSAGKTSIVNRILTQDNSDVPTLPVSSKATTAIPTYIANAKDFNAQFTTVNGKLKSISTETFTKTTKELISKIYISSLIQYYVVSYNNDKLEGLSILDTPGFNSTDKEDTNRTVEVIKEADALFWIFDVNMGDINETSLNIIEKHLNGLPLYIIINKCDTKSNNEIEAVESKIKETLFNRNISTKAFIRFSDKNKVDDIMKYIQEIKSEKNYNPILSKVEDYIENAEIDIKQKYNTISEDYLESRESLKVNQRMFKKYKKDALEITSDMFGMHEKKDKLFSSSSYYKLKEYEYLDFKKKLKRIEDIFIDLTNNLRAIEHLVECITVVSNEMTKLEEKRNSIDDIGKTFKKLISDLNKGRDLLN